ncbi:hypothetical protein I317_02632 [Kwoniella heveanensis CBS 569]|nr:hypothetical protein I317_02632 [Kwoniella heveanensis CBS 569]
MTTQNLQSAPLRTSGHKEPTEDHATIAQMNSQGDSADPEALLKNRILNRSEVSRAALYDQDDFLCVASSTKQFDVEPEDIRKILDGLLTYSRQGDPTVASGDGEPPKHFSVGKEGGATVKSGDGEAMVAELNGKTLIATRTAKFVLLVEANEGANQASLETIVQAFQEGLQQLT